MVSSLLLAAALVGRATVVDGDTLDLHGQRVRLWGIDAPESAQVCQARGVAYRCGQSASFALNVLAIGTLTCEAVDRDRYGRIVARCLADAAGDIGAAMVRAGWAVDFQRYSRGTYAAEESEARTAGRGIWSGAFEQPEDWRRLRRLRVKP